MRSRDPARRASGPHGRHQADPEGVDGPEREVAALARGARCRERQPSERLPRLRRRRGSGGAVRGDGAARRGAARGTHRARCRRADRGDRRRGAGAGCAGRAARLWRRASRSEAVAHFHHAARYQAPRLRPGATERRRGGVHDARHARRHAVLHGARTVDRVGRRTARGPLRVRGHPLRDAHGEPGVSRRYAARGLPRGGARESSRPRGRSGGAGRGSG